MTRPLRASSIFTVNTVASACVLHTHLLSPAPLYSHREGKALNLLQDLYAHSERISASCPITDAAIIRAEVTLENNSTTAWNGKLHIIVEHCKPLTNNREKTKLHEQPTSATIYDFKSTENSASEPKRNRSRAAEHTAPEEGQHSSRSHWHQRRPNIKVQQPAPGQHDLQWRERVRIPPGQTSFGITGHVLRSPHLWWPLNMGEQVLVAIYRPCNLTNTFADHAPLNISSCHTQPVA